MVETIEFRLVLWIHRQLRIDYNNAEKTYADAWEPRRTPRGIDQVGIVTGGGCALRKAVGEGTIIGLETLSKR